MNTISDSLWEEVTVLRKKKQHKVDKKKSSKRW